MSLNVLFAGPARDWPDYAPALRLAFRDAALDARIADDLPPQSVDYIVHAPDSALQDFTPYDRCKAVLSLWAGVEAALRNPTLTQPLARMADPGLREGMVEWVTGHVLRYHLGIDAVLAGQDGVWRPDLVAPLARDRPVGILGLGALGSAAGQALAALNFPVFGWSRHEKTIVGIDCRSGDGGLTTVLENSAILVLLLPETEATRNLMTAERLAMLPLGAHLLNPGRGALIDDAALLAALDSGYLAHATLDVFRTEPLPATHPFWSHRRVTVSPHVASATRPGTASAFIAANIARVEAGLPLLAEVDRAAGY